ncbi:MAG: ABC transporter permease [Oscillospiraceae bacterium]|nr:ABC transporter permease [Oscillospiraceae bacterium]
MSKLLRGDFVRLFKSKIFWLGVIVMFGVAVMMVYGVWSNKQELLQAFPDSDPEVPPDRTLLEGVMIYVGIIVSVIVGIFVGADYRCGTIRNKHVMGHSRATMYFSNLIICFTAALIMHITYIAVIVGASAVGITDEFWMSAEDILVNTLVSACSVLAMTSVILLLCMLVSSRTASTVIAIILSIVSILAAQRVHGMLYDDLFVQVIEPDGTTSYEKACPDDDPSTKRKILRFVFDYFPENQLYQLQNGMPGQTSDGPLEPNKKVFPLYSLSLIAISTTAGVLVFRKKDLK